MDEKVTQLVPVSIDKLRLYFNTLMNHLEELGVQEVNLAADYYWDISLDEWTKLENAPVKSFLGSFADEVENLDSMIHHDSVIGYGFVWLGALLRRVGQLNQS